MITVLFIASVMLAACQAETTGDQDTAALPSTTDGQETPGRIIIETPPVEPGSMDRAPLIEESVIKGSSQEQTGPASAPMITLHLLDIGMGDSALIQTQRGANILYNCGRSEDSEEIKTYLEDHGISRIDALIVSHDSREVVGGCAPLFDRFDIRRVFTNGKSGESEEYGRFEYKAIQAGAKRISGAERIVIDEDVVTILYTAFERGGTQMRHVWDESLALWIGYDDVGLLLPGHCHQGCEKRLLKIEEDLQADVLWAGDHGHHDATTDEFLDAVNPSIVLISTGREENPLRLPHEDTLERLHDRAIRVYRTDTSGTIIVTTDGKEIDVQTERAERPQKEPVIRPVVDVTACPFASERGREDFYAAACPQVARIPAASMECFLSREAAQAREKVEAKC